MTLENGVQGLEYSQHLVQWKAAFQQFYGAQQPHRDTQADAAQLTGSGAVPATLSDGTSNPYSAVLSGLQTLLDGPLFKPQAGDSAPVIQSAPEPNVAGPTSEAAVEELETDQSPGADAEQAGVVAAAGGPSSSGPTPSTSRRPRKRAASPPQLQVDVAAVQQESAPAPATSTPAGRQPVSKKRRSTQPAPPAARAGGPPPATDSLNDLATLAAAVADEPYDDPVLGDQQQLQDQALLAYASGSVGGGMVSQPEAPGGSARTGRGGGSRARQRTPAASSSGADEGDSMGLSFPLVNEDGKPLTKQQIKRLRRQQSNRESARRSRQRKAEEANMLAQRLGEMEMHCGTLQAKNTTLLAEVQQLRGIIDMIAHDTSTLAAQVGELGGTVSAEVLANINWLAAARSNGGWPAQGGAGVPGPEGQEQEEPVE